MTVDDPVRERIQDAIALWGNDRVYGTLLMLLVAIEATAQKRGGKGGNGGRFIRFLADELPLRTHVQNWSLQIRADPAIEPPELPEPPVFNSPIEDGEFDIWQVEFDAAFDEYKQAWEEYARAMDEYAVAARPFMMRIEHVFWYLCRCRLGHGLPCDQVRLCDRTPETLSIKLEERVLFLSAGWLDVLAAITVEAPENHGIFPEGAPRFATLTAG